MFSVYSESAMPTIQGIADVPQLLQSIATASPDSFDAASPDLLVNAGAALLRIAAERKDGWYASLPPVLPTRVDLPMATEELGARLRSKRFTILYFSASWCAPCHRFTPILAELYAEQKDDLEIIFCHGCTDEVTARPARPIASP